MRILLYCLPIIYRDNMYIIAKTNVFIPDEIIKEVKGIDKEEAKNL